VLGVISFQDVVKRLVAAKLKPSSTPAGSIMTENPVVLDADQTFLDAMYKMKEGRFLNLPVVEGASSRTLGLVNVMDLVQCLCKLGGDDGGRTFWSSTMQDEEGWESGSDAGSVASHHSSTRGGGGNIDEPSPEDVVVRTVKSLRPSSPLVLPKTTMITDIVKSMLHKRVVAALLTGKDGTLEGIITDKDIARRVVAVGKRPEETRGEEVMTPSPTTVGSDADCVDALTKMVKGGFTHLPVVDDGARVAGVLDIARCLDDAIRRLEGMEMRKLKAANTSSTDGAMQALLAQAAQGGVKDPALLMQFMKLLQESSNSSGGSTTSRAAFPTVREILLETQASVILTPNSTAREVAKAMEKCRKAVVITEKSALVGIVSFKDIMSRVIYKGLSPDSTLASEIMTPFPNSIEADKTLLDALYEMRNGRIMNLPVVEPLNDGKVLGVVSVMEVVVALSRLGGSSTDDGGRAFWTSTMGSKDDEAWESGSDTGSVRSNLSYDGWRMGTSVTTPTARAKVATKKLVKDLAYSKALAVGGGSSVLEAAKLMEKEGSAAVLVTENRGRVLAGILTDNDITRRVVGSFKSIHETLVQAVMTKVGYLL